MSQFEHSLFKIPNKNNEFWTTNNEQRPEAEPNGA